MKLWICESPNKTKTIKQILNELGLSDIKVMASVGHIIEIADTGEYNMGIDVKNNFNINYQIMAGKKDVVLKLKEAAKAADIVYLGSDGDREGEVIAWSLKEFLKIPAKKCKRVIYHEITKSAIKKAIDTAGDLNYPMVYSGQARSCADKIIGYRLSNIARSNVGARSVGRCQSAGLKLIVKREEEIQSFNPEIYFDFYLHFTKNKVDFTAKYTGTENEEIKCLKSLDECKEISSECKSNPYSILNVVHKDAKENPKPPFITSTFQQEVSKKLNISVKKAMDCAQKLFEGIEVGKKHQALITYHRTDSAQYSPEFVKELEEFIKDTYGKDYYAPIKSAKKSENAQEGHEGIRVIDLTMTPERLKNYIKDDYLLKVYSIIWKRTVASSMSPAVVANTIYTIQNGKHRFSMTSKELKFDGYRKIYAAYEDDDKPDEQIIKETFRKNEALKNTNLEAVEKSTQPPRRFNESSFIKELDKQGIGRPSTYATILSILLDERRGYSKVEDKYIVPTALGIKLSRFLDERFSDVISIKYTAELEKSLDAIANNKKDKVTFLKGFYNNIVKNIAAVEPAAAENKICAKCGKTMRLLTGKYSKFWGCSGYPNCKYTESLKK